MLVHASRLFLCATLLRVDAQSSATAPPALATAYAPTPTACPAGISLIRGSSSDLSISADETAFLKQKTNLNSDISSYLSNLAAYASKNAPGVTLPDYFSPNATSPLTPKLGLSVSGGGYRAAIFGLSIFHALDSRNSTSAASGLGGVLQVSQYMAGLSGGSWAVGSLAQANFPTIPEVFFGPATPPTSETSPNGQWGGWNANNDILAANVTYIGTLLAGMGGKARQFPVSFADLWALALARHFVNGTTTSNFFDETASVHGAGLSFSDLPSLSSAQDGSMPFPIVVVNSREQDTANAFNPAGGLIPLKNTLYEVNPFEFGSWDAGLSAFTPTKFIGSANTSACLVGFDKLAFVMSTSSNLFNEFNTSAAALANSSIASAIVFINSTFVNPLPKTSLQANIELDGAIWPNPFKGLNSSTFAGSGQDVLTLVDGGEDGEVIPLAPLVVKSRALDVVIAIDGTNDNQGFAQGSSIVASQNRTSQDSTLASIYRFPPLPTSVGVFIGQGLATRPTFFGCGNFTNASGANVTSGGGDTPLIVYIANGAAPPGQAPLTNTTTTQTIYSNAQIQGFFAQTLDIATQGFSGNGNSTKDAQWPLCLACAIFEPARARASNVARAPLCESCFSRYCWDGNQTAAASAPSSTAPGGGSAGKNSARRTVSSLSTTSMILAMPIAMAVVAGVSIL